MTTEGRDPDLAQQSEDERSRTTQSGEPTSERQPEGASVSGGEAEGDGETSDIQSLLSRCPDFYRFQFASRQPDEERSDCDFLLRLKSDEEKQAVQELACDKTDFSLNNDQRLLEASYTGGATADDDEDDWKKVVLKTCSTAVELLRWASVPVGLKAKQTKQAIEKECPGVTCELNENELSLLILSGDAQQVQRARQMAESARPSKDFHTEFTTESGIRVSLVEGDITKVPADCIVSAVDGGMSFSGGVSRDIAQAVGKPLTDACKKFIKDNRRLHVTDVFPTTGAPLWKTVIHTCGPYWGDYQDKDLCQEHLTDTVLNCLKKAAKLGHSSIALPFISSRTFKVPAEVCAASYKQAIDAFDFDPQRGNALKKIVFVDIDKNRIFTIQQKFQSIGLEKAETLRLVLVGSTGVGKSMTGNNIVKREVFKVADALKSETIVSSLERASRPNLVIEVVDTPGLFDKASDKKHEQVILTEILKTVALCLPGPHAFLMVFRGDARFSAQEEEVCTKIKELFSDPNDKENLLQFLIIVFTHIRSQRELEKKMKPENTPLSVQNLLNECGGRVIGIDNQESYDEPHPDIERLVQMALDLRERNGGQSVFFSNDLIKRCLMIVQSGTCSGMSLEEIKEAIRLGKDLSAMEAIARDRQAQTGAQEARTKCVVM